MFSKIKRFIDDLEKGVFEVLKETVRENDLILKNYIVNEQLFKEGIDGKGVKLPGYKRTTIRIKISKNQPADRTTLKDTGDFHASIEINAFSDRIEVSSNLSYSEFIIRRYGEDSLKITKENMEEFFALYFLPNLKDYVSSKKSG